MDRRRPWGWRPRWLRPRLAAVLGGGAALGALEAGVIETLARHGIVPDLLVGTSIGAINAAFWAFNPEPEAGRLLELWLSAGRSTMFPDHAISMLGRVARSSDHLTSQNGVARVVRAAGLDEVAIEESRIPLAVTAADPDHGDRVILRRGPLLPALLASTAIPVLFPAVEIGGRRLMDGGAVANCDVEAAVEAGMTDVLVVDVMGEGPAAGESIWDVGDRVVRIVLRRQTDLVVQAHRGRARIAVLRPRLDVATRVGDFDRTLDLYRLGRDAAEAFLTNHLRGGRQSGGFRLRRPPRLQVLDRPASPPDAGGGAPSAG